MDIILYNIAVAIILLIVSYLAGSIPNAIWIGKVFFGKDPRDFGSGNAGGTNAGRVFGKRVGIIVILLDALKLIIPLYGAWLFLTLAPINNGQPLMNTVQQIYLEGKNDAAISWPIYWLVVIGCSIGHCFPIFAGFRGGKNVSSFYGLTIGASWAIGFIPGILFLVLLKIKKYVSLSSICSSIFAVILSWVWAILIMTKTVQGEWVWFINYGPALECNYVFAICVTLSSGLLVFQHRSNIKRLRDGNERKITWMK